MDNATEFPLLDERWTLSSKGLRTIPFYRIVDPYGKIHNTHVTIIGERNDFHRCLD